MYYHGEYFYLLSLTQMLPPAGFLKKFYPDRIRRNYVYINETRMTTSISNEALSPFVALPTYRRIKYL